MQLYIKDNILSNFSANKEPRGLLAARFMIIPTLYYRASVVKEDSLEVAVLNALSLEPTK